MSAKLASQSDWEVFFGQLAYNSRQDSTVRIRIVILDVRFIVPNPS